MAVTIIVFLASCQKDYDGIYRPGKRIHKITISSSETDTTIVETWTWDTLKAKFPLLPDTVLPRVVTCCYKYDTTLRSVDTIRTGQTIPNRTNIDSIKYENGVTILIKHRRHTFNKVFCKYEYTYNNESRLTEIVKRNYRNSRVVSETVEDESLRETYAVEYDGQQQISAINAYQYDTLSNDNVKVSTIKFTYEGDPKKLKEVKIEIAASDDGADTGAIASACYRAMRMVLPEEAVQIIQTRRSQQLAQGAKSRIADIASVSFVWDKEGKNITEVTVNYAGNSTDKLHYASYDEEGNPFHDFAGLAAAFSIENDGFVSYCSENNPLECDYSTQKQVRYNYSYEGGLALKKRAYRVYPHKISKIVNHNNNYVTIVKNVEYF